ncbi:MAG: hypothetical protein WD342_01875 [Verrucomicrobiales bacterium]
MKTSLYQNSTVAALCLGLGSLPLVWAQDSKTEVGTAAETKTGSAKYTTTINRETKGELSEEDFRTASLLGSRILVHLDKASKHLLDDEASQAKPELEHAKTLVNIIRDILPATKVETVVKDESGKEVYRYVDHVQDDQIPLYRHMIAVDVIEPVLDAKDEESSTLAAAELKGMRLADAEVINASFLLDLGYVERKINRALEQIGQIDEALASVILAQTGGVSFVTNKEESPLIDAQSALRLAERMIEDQRYETAEENLRLARLHLETYRQAISDQAGEKAKEMQSQIEQLFGKLEEEGAGKKVRGFWNRMTSWFANQPDETEPTGDSSAANEEQEAVKKATKKE